MLSPYVARLSGYQCYHKFPHSLMGLGFKAVAPSDLIAKANGLADLYRVWLHETESALPMGQKLRRRWSQVYRSKGERYHTSAYYTADFTIDVASALANAG